MFEYHAKVERVVDGDTIDVEIDLGFKTFIRERIRIARLDTAETWRPEDEEERMNGEAATAVALDWMPPGTKIILRTRKRGGSTGARGRYIAEIVKDGENYTDMMTALGHNKMES